MKTLSIAPILICFLQVAASPGSEIEGLGTLLLGIVVVIVIVWLGNRRKRRESKESTFNDVVKSVFNIEASTEDDTDNFLFSSSKLPKEFRESRVFISSWNVETGDFVKKGEHLAEFESEKTYEVSFNSDAECDGIIEIFTESSSRYSGEIIYLKEKEKTFTIHKNPTDEKRIELLKKRFYNVPVVKTDEFIGMKEITWSVVGGRSEIVTQRDCVVLWDDERNDKFLFFTFNNLKKKDYIVFRFEPKEYKVVVGSKISFLFEGGRIIKFTIIQKPYKQKEKSQETKLQLSVDELDTFINYTFEQYQIELPDGMKLRGKVSDNHQFITKQLAVDFKDIVKREIADYEPLTEKVEVEEISDNNDACYVYLMIDTTNNYHKIGISNYPDYREKTLQSEKPTIEMICSKQFPNRKIAVSFEQALHQAYSDKRIRGEWFNLDVKEIDDIRASLIG